MAYQIKTKGIVLHEMPIGDYDKRLILLTKEQGKVTVFVKGARRPNSKLLACCQLFAYGEFVLSKGKNSYNVYQAELLEHFHRLRLDIEDMTYAMFMLEFVDFVAGEDMQNTTLMKLLLYGLNAINKQRMPSKLVVQTFQLKAMSVIGYTPWVNDCALCHSQEGIKFFSPELGGFLCSDETHQVKGKILLSPGTIYCVRYILSKAVDEIFSFELEEIYLLELEAMVEQFVMQNLDHSFKTLEFLKTL